MQDVENLFLEVTRSIDDYDFSNAKLLLNDILSIDPGYGRAHNFLGWIYETKIKDFNKAKRHYELAIKFLNDTYPAVYVNYAYLLIEYGYMKEAENIISKGMQVSGSDKAALYYQKGKIAEYRQDFVKAFKFYRHAQLMNFNKEFHRMINGELDRVKTKMNFFQKLRIKF